MFWIESQFIIVLMNIVMLNAIELNVNLLKVI
jgi:hypothetical protein